MAKEVKMTSSFCYNHQDFREVMENVGQGKRRVPISGPGSS